MRHEMDPMAGGKGVRGTKPGGSAGVAWQDLPGERGTHFGVFVFSGCLPVAAHPAHCVICRIAVYPFIPPFYKRKLTGGESLCIQFAFHNSVWNVPLTP